MVEFGKQLQKSTRGGDVVARYGGDEYACVFLDCNSAGGMVVTDRIRGDLFDFTSRTGLTMSAGIATYEDEMSGTEPFLEAAHRALGAAQAAGGDRTELP